MEMTRKPGSVAGCRLRQRGWFRSEAPGVAPLRCALRCIRSAGLGAFGDFLFCFTRGDGCQ